MNSLLRPLVILSGEGGGNQPLFERTGQRGVAEGFGNFPIVGDNRGMNTFQTASSPTPYVYLLPHNQALYRRLWSKLAALGDGTATALHLLSGLRLLRGLGEL